MCGITGFVGNYDLSILKKMNRTLVHRGPDEEGYWRGDGVGLAMRRLSIIDVESGHQPISNEDDTVWTVFNGEIYNFRELRRELAGLGHRFKTDHSDTETIVHAYEQYGDDFVRKLNGMFAIAVWDDRNKRLLLYRDRLGEKPLYFWRHGRHFFFASEIKAILALPFFRRELNEEALFYYLGFKHAPRQCCFFKNIESLSPGECVVFEQGRIRRKLYWEIDASRELKISEHDAIAEIRRLLKSSVRYRMISDVPLGAYLSGGVDSSEVVGLMSRIRHRPIDTFSLTYKDALPHKERDQVAAFEMSKRFGTNHREYQMGFEEFKKDLDKIIASFDEPFSGTISTFFLSKLIRRHVKVAISGDGADELFGSYKAHRLAYPLFHLNRLIQKGYDPRRLNERQKRLLAPFDQEVDDLLKIRADRPFEWHSKLVVYPDQEKKALLDPRLNRRLRGCSTRDYYRAAYARCKTDDPLNQVLQVECQHLLPDQVLCFVDRLSMAHSVEVRPPFLDHRLVEFVFKLPGTMKIKQGRTKYILKQACLGVLPEWIVERPKEGFILPYYFWMQKYLGRSIRSVLAPRNLNKHGCFNPGYVTGLLEEYEKGNLERANRIYVLYIFQLWWNQYFG